MEIVRRIRSGNIRAAARLLRDIDDRIPSAHDALRELYPYTGKAHVVGITGSPGVGKSTLVDGLTVRFRKDGLTVGILAIDPTSPFTGGAILGDRIRMQRHFPDDGVFIRSLATRGQFGGLTRSTNDMISVLDAMGKDVILVETVGVGQDEVEIVNSAHTTVLVTVPGLGDDVQALKSGILEIGNILVVNKADREGAEKTASQLRGLVDMRKIGGNGDGWNPVIVKTDAHRGMGMEELYSAICGHRDFLLRSGREEWNEMARQRAKRQLMEALREEAVKAILNRMEDRGKPLDALLDEVVERRTDPYSLASEIVSEKLCNGR
ncbi:MAG: methylmalonyl Co-A mutase-associated GTPase MeaB [Desulfobacteraceae bacterium]|nr:methylmalonyl Co-A mutase-associated GTPase MeaB [Desulfobacteraceae bacterium]